MENHENIENPRIPNGNHENQEILRILYENVENHDNPRIPRENHETNENHIIQ